MIPWSSVSRRMNAANTLEVVPAPIFKSVAGDPTIPPDAGFMISDGIAPSGEATRLST
jgi:hypothetical protein